MAKKIYYEILATLILSPKKKIENLRKTLLRHRSHAVLTQCKNKLCIHIYAKDSKEVKRTRITLKRYGKLPRFYVKEKVEKLNED